MSIQTSPKILDPGVGPCSTPSRRISQYWDSGCPGCPRSIPLEHQDLRIRLPEFGICKERNSPAPKCLPFHAQSGFAILDLPFPVPLERSSRPDWRPEERVENRKNAEHVPKSPPKEAVAAFPSPHPIFPKSQVMISSSDAPDGQSEFRCCRWNRGKMGWEKEECCS